MPLLGAFETEHQEQIKVNGYSSTEAIRTLAARQEIHIYTSRVTRLRHLYELTYRSSRSLECAERHRCTIPLHENDAALLCLTAVISGTWYILPGIYYTLAYPWRYTQYEHVGVLLLF